MKDPDDRLCDDLLRNVPLPAGLPARVAPAALFDDAAIERLLARVDIPAGLDGRIRQAQATAADGLPVPQPDRRRGVAPAGWMIRWLLSGELLADSAAVATALSIVALMFFAGTELSRRLSAPADPGREVALRTGGGPRPGAAASAPTSAVARARDQVSPRGQGRQTDAVARGVDGDVDGGQLGRAQPGHLRPGAGGVTTMEGPARMVDRPPVVRSGDVPAVAKPVEVRAAPVPAAASDPARAETGGVRTVLLPSAGRMVPRVPGFDIAFEMAHGESPFVDPASAAALATDHPPLSLRTDSFDLFAAVVRRHGDRSSGRRASRAGPPVVRVEEILAALPAAADAGRRNGAEIGLSIDAVRSLRAQPASLLVEVCATAPSWAGLGGDRLADGPLDAMLLLDQSGGPFAAVSWQWLCQGLTRIVGQMRSVDRLSLIVCGERPRLVALRADAAHLAALLPELVRESVVRSADFDAAFRLAAAVGRREGRPTRIVAVAHAGSLERCRAEGRAALAAWQVERAAGVPTGSSPPVGFVVVDPQPPLQAAGGDREKTDSATGWIAADPIAIGRAMMARAFGRSTLVAAGCRLEVAFEPARVGAYRIVGHRQTAADALANGRPRPIELHVGESVRVVYEVVRRPTAKAPAGGGLVSATLAWTPAALDGQGGLATGGRDGERQTRASLADEPAANSARNPGPNAVPGRTTADDQDGGLPSGHGCELLLAVALGERLGASVHAEPWRQTAAGVASLAARWQARGDVTPQGRLLIECLEHLGVGLEPASR